ncbi:class I SAM-dependent methyltransferase [Kitasatospora sp. NPDC056138]|uniref:class I SAM-dependent methyltransferase n=1 Tax=Kitasatospora sp. NPDC056138 TaxID=3345724 RepID=UPI0035D8BA25
MITVGEFDAHERDLWAGRAVAYQGSFARLCAHAVPALLDAAGVARGVRLLDVGTGPGTVAAAAGERGARVTAVDADPGMVELAAAGAPRAEVRVAVLPRLPFADGEFDAVTANFVVNHVEDPIAALAELRRVTRPGGRIAATIWPGGPNPGMSLFDRALTEGGAERPELPRVPVEFERDPDGFAGLLVRAGWPGARCREVRWVHRPAPEEWWSGPAGGVANVGRVLTSQSPETVARIKAVYDRLAGERLGPDGLLGFEVTALLASAERAAEGAEESAGEPSPADERSASLVTVQQGAHVCTGERE